MNARRNLIRTKLIALTIAAATAASFQTSAATLYVSQTSPSPTPPYSNPETAAHNIQDAVDVATDGDTVLVAPGDYGVTNQVAVTNDVRLQSTHGASQTFLTARGGPGTWCLAISNSLAVADGFSFRQATANPGYPGGAVLVGGTIQNCNFSNFFCVAPIGGAIVMSGGVVSNSVITYRRYGGGFGAAAVYGDGTLITDCMVLGTESSGSGGGVSLTNSRLQNSVISGVGTPSSNVGGAAVTAISSTVAGCTISNNYNVNPGGGAYIRDSLMDRCIVTGNTTVSGSNPGSGGGGVFATNSIIRNSLIVSNRALRWTESSGLGGGVYMQGGALLNCTLTGNSATEAASYPGGGGGVFAESGGITNCIIYFNSVDLDRPSSNWFNFGSAVFDHCCTAPAPGGAGNITQDPQFIDTTNGNFHLALTSPCIGAGAVQPWMTGAQDLDGNPRTTNGQIDMGAYQSRSPSILSVTRSGSNIILQWPSAGTSNFILQQSSDLSAPESWSPSTATVTDDGANKSVTVPATNNAQFFRLR